MDLFKKQMKKKLDFSRPTYDEREIKIPKNITNQTLNPNPDLNHWNVSETMKSEVSNEKTLFADDECDSDSSSIVSQAVGGSEETVSVHLRLKPIGSAIEDRIPDVYLLEDNNIMLKGKNQRGSVTKYTFTSIFNQLTDQKTIFSTCIQPVLSTPFSSTGAVFACYGVSNSGKTYTMIGEENQAGVIPRALAQVFSEYSQQIAEFPCVKIVNDQITILEDDQVMREIDATKQFLTESQKSFKGKIKTSWIEDISKDHQFKPAESSGDFEKVYIWISFVEIFNEKMIDLLKQPVAAKGSEATSQRPLKIISNDRHSYIQGLTSLYVSSLEEAIQLLQISLRYVNYAATGLNNHSSRSHTVFTISMIKECDSNFTYSSFKFCDLAGAERSKKTGNIGERLKEAGGINKSLMVLGKCLETVQQNQKPGVKKDIVPVRESKLTFLLQSSLTGKEKFSMIVNLLPTVENFEENVNVLHFGSIANTIITRRVKAKKMSARYSYFKNCVNSPKLINSSFHEDDEGNESSLDLSYERSLLSKEELIQLLHKKEVEYDFLRKAIELKEREFLRMKQELLKENQLVIESMVNNEKAFFEKKEQINRNYWEKKIDSVRQKYEKKLSEWAEDYELLERKNRKLEAKLKMTDDYGIIDLEDNDESDSETNEEV